MITAIFEVPGMTAQQYDTVMDRLDAAGMAAPSGRVSHVATGTDDGWFVVDVWQSGEQLEAFAANHLGPVLADVVGAVPPPSVRPAHRYVSA